MTKIFLSPFKLNINSESKFTLKDLHPFQKKAVTALEKFHQPGGKAAYGILKIPTGGGKTKTACYWITSNLLANNYKLVWIAHRRELLEQATEEFNDMAGLIKGMKKNPVGRLVVGGYSPGAEIKPSDDLIFISIQNLSRGTGEQAFMNFIDKNKNTKILFVIDEAHHSEASTYKYIIGRYIQKNKNYSLLGLTATPTRTVESERSRLLKLFNDKIIYEVSISELISAEILAKPIPDTIKTNVKFEDGFTVKEKEYFDKFKELHPNVLKRIANSVQRNKGIVEAYSNKKHLYGKTLIFATDIIHCKTLANEFSKKGFKVAYVHSGKQDNIAILSDFKNTKRYDILINIEKLTEGFDCPDIQTIFLARPTQSEILFSQMIGRGLRGPKSNPPGTEFCYLVSFMDHWDKFTGWLDVSEIPEFTESQEITKTEQLKNQQETLITPWNIVENVYNDLLPYASQIPYNEHKMDYLPHGWFNLGFFNEEEGIPTTRKILVFDNQYYAWKEVLNILSSLKAKPSANEINKVYHTYFDDLPIPRVQERNLKLVVDFAFSLGYYIEPDYYTFSEKLQADPKKLAFTIYTGNLTGETKRNSISEWYQEHKLLREIYDNEMEFAREVNLQIHFLEYPDDRNMRIFTGNPFIPVDKVKVNLPSPDNKVLKKYFHELTQDKFLFPDGFTDTPEVKWTDKVINCYFGYAYKCDNIKLIKINRLLNIQSLNKEVVKFVLYHEMLHFDVSFKHTKDFYLREGKYENAVELKSLLLNISYDYDIQIPD